MISPNGTRYDNIDDVLHINARARFTHSQKGPSIFITVCTSGKKKRQNIYFFHSVFRAQYLRFLNVCSRYTVTLCECCQHLVLTERSDEYFIVETITGTITMHICHTLAQTDGERADIRVECVSGRCHIFSDSKWFD